MKLFLEISDEVWLLWKQLEVFEYFTKICKLVEKWFKNEDNANYYLLPVINGHIQIWFSYHSIKGPCITFSKKSRSSRHVRIANIFRLPVGVRSFTSWKKISSQSFSIYRSVKSSACIKLRNNNFFLWEKYVENNCLKISF